jgi:hypothetical protein
VLLDIEEPAFGGRPVTMGLMAGASASRCCGSSGWNLRKLCDGCTSEAAEMRSEPLYPLLNLCIPRQLPELSRIPVHT